MSGTGATGTGATTSVVRGSVAPRTATINRRRSAGRTTTVRALVHDQRWMLFGGLVVLNILDLITTAMVLDRGGQERNPFVQPIIDSIWQVGAIKALVLLLIATLLTRCTGSRIAELALTATTGWYLAVVSWNIAVLTII